MKSFIAYQLTPSARITGIYFPAFLAYYNRSLSAFVSKISEFHGCNYCRYISCLFGAQCRVKRLNKWGFVILDKSRAVYFPFAKSISIASSCATGLVTGLVQKHNCHLIMIRNEVEVRVQIVQVY